MPKVWNTWCLHVYLTCPIITGCWCDDPSTQRTIMMPWYLSLETLPNLSSVNIPAVPPLLVCQTVTLYPVRWQPAFFSLPVSFVIVIPSHYSVYTLSLCECCLLNIKSQSGIPSLVRNVIVLPISNEGMVISQLLFPSLPPEEQQGDNAWEGRKVPTPHSSSQRDVSGSQLSLCILCNLTPQCREVDKLLFLSQKTRGCLKQVRYEPEGWKALLFCCQPKKEETNKKGKSVLALPA